MSKNKNMLKLKKFFDKNKIYYEYSLESEGFSFMAERNNNKYNIYLAYDLDMDSIFMISTIDCEVTSDKLLIMLEYLNSVNRDSCFGYFTLMDDRKHIMYCYTLPLYKRKINDKIIVNIIERTIDNIEGPIERIYDIEDADLSELIDEIVQEVVI